MKALAIISGKGGVGKTSTAINLGISLISLGKDTTIVDANLLTPDIALSLGAPVVPIALQHALSGEKSILHAIYMHESGMKIIPSSLALRSPDHIEQLSNLKNIIPQVKQSTEFILIDSPAGVGNDVANIISASDECLIVTNAEMPALSSALKAIKLAEGLGKPIAGVIVSKFRDKDEGQMGLEEISSFLDAEIIGTVRNDKNMKSAICQREPITLSYPRSNASKDYAAIARRISRMDIGQPRFLQKIYF